MTQTAAQPDVRERVYIDGAWVESAGVESIDVHNPTTEETIGRVPAAVPADIDRAVRAARAAFPGWSATSVAERGALLKAIAAEIERRLEELARGVAREVGTPIEVARIAQVGFPALSFASAADDAVALRWQEEVGASLVVREPIGVVGAITPWNFPLHQVAAKVAPALAAGCTVVLKPSEITPLTAFVLADIADEVGLPPGVLNVVSGVGPEVGEALASHPEVDMMTFTGSTRAGRRVYELAARNIVKVTLELGGKSANVVLDDADLEQAIPDAIAKCYLNGGQTCNALSRLLVPRAKLGEVEQLAAEAAAAWVVGDPVDEETQLGPMVTAVQRERVRGYIDGAMSDGARLLTGGSAPPEGLERGFFVRPTVFGGVTNDMTIAREEVFGPVLSILGYDSEAQAIELANDTPYGLYGGVWSADEERAITVARALRTGAVEINGGAFNPRAPFGGYKQSGIGRELGRFGLEEYLEYKALNR